MGEVDEVWMYADGTVTQVLIPDAEEYTQAHAEVYPHVIFFFAELTPAEV